MSKIFYLNNKNIFVNKESKLVGSYKISNNWYKFNKVVELKIYDSYIFAQKVNHILQNIRYKVKIKDQTFNIEYNKSLNRYEFRNKNINYYIQKNHGTSECTLYNINNLPLAYFEKIDHYKSKLLYKADDLELIKLSMILFIIIGKEFVMPVPPNIALRVDKKLVS
jgi:hypothetical protein